MSESLSLFAPPQSQLTVALLASSFSLLLLVLSSCRSFPPFIICIHLDYHLYTSIFKSLICSASPSFITHPVCPLFMPFSHSCYNHHACRCHSQLFVLCILQSLGCFVYCQQLPLSHSLSHTHTLFILLLSLALHHLIMCFSRPLSFIKFKGINHQSDAWSPVMQ